MSQTCSITALLYYAGVEKLRTELDMVHWNREGFKVRTRLSPYYKYLLYVLLICSACRGR
jgi:hypothetical protein